MSIECEYCGREFKKKQGLTVHLRSCKAKTDNESNEELKTVRSEARVQETPIESGSKVERQIKKLLDTRSSTYDAHTRHQIDLQIKELRES